jgi:hypothetical protein
MPVLLVNAKLQRQLERLARKKGKEIGEMVNQLVKKEFQFL